MKLPQNINFTLLFMAIFYKKNSRGATSWENLQLEVSFQSRPDLSIIPIPISIL